MHPKCPQTQDDTNLSIQTHASAITDPKSVAIVGPAAKLDDLYVYAREQKIHVQKLDIRGKVHNPENKEISTDLSHLCNDTPCLQLPEASSLRVPVRSNRTGERLHSGSLIEEVVTTILASRCDWFQLLNEVAGDLNVSKRTDHTFLIFGLYDCVSVSPFHKHRLQVTKSEVHGLIRRVPQDRDEIKRLQEPPMFQDGAIAVVGASCRLPGANNLDELWNLMANGTDCHQEISIVKDRFDLYGSFRASQSGNFASGRKFYGNFIDDVRRFDNSFFGMNAREATNLDPQQRILLELSFEALDASGYLTKHRRESGDNVGCFIGASLVEYLDNTNAHGPTAYTSTGTIRAFLCGRLSYYYGWCGPAEVIDTACSSSLVAINRACKAIQSGECNMALAGGVNIITGINNYLDLGKAGFLSTTGQCKPFDKSADGYCRSDGAGLVVLKSLKQAMNDGDEILGIIPGIATNQGGLSSSITVPHSAAQQALYRSVIKQSGLEPEQITYVEAHGTGTQAGDPLEMESIRSIFGNPSRPDTLHVGSIKGNIGHCETAAGVASLLKVLAMIKNGQIPPQANYQQLNPKISNLEPDGLGISRNLRAWDVPFRAALVNSYGAAGSNCALLCCEMPREGNQEKREAHELIKQSAKPSIPVFLSAASPQSLLDQAWVLGLYLRHESKNLDIESVSFTLNGKRQRHKYFISMTAKDTTDLAHQLLSVEPAAISEVPNGQKHVILSFSGQNNDRVVLDKAFYDAYPVFRSYIESCNKEIRDLGFHSIIPAIFQEEAIDDVAILQCSIFALQYACAMCWINAGLKISMIVGHSLGELTVLATSGALSLSDTVKLVATRGHLIQSRWGPEKGAMLALNCDTDDFENIAAQIKSTPEGGKLEIACYNAPTSLVAVGTSATIDAVESLISTTPSLRKIKFKRLQTSHGFHSALVEPILGYLQSMNESLSWNEPKIDLELCAAGPLRSMQNYNVSKHAREPVYFSDAIRRIEEKLGASKCIWLEAGIETPIIPMVRKATRNPEAMSFHPIKSHGGRNLVDAVGDVVSSLWKSGVFLTHWSHLSDHAGNRKHVWLPPYQFEKNPHWRENIDRTIEMQLLLSEVASTKEVENLLPPPAQLVSRKDPTSTNSTAEFLINTQSQRYQKIVGGHAVRGRPLCPASAYMECVVMAIQLSCKDTINAGLVFESLHFHSALSLNPEGEVVIQLDEIISGSSWKFNIRSSTSKGPRPKQTSHGNGIVTLAQNSMLDAFQRLIVGSTERLERKEDAEKLMSKRAYGLFGLVVDYDHFFRGIRFITINEWEAVATISVPDNQPSREESTSWSICDTVTIDAFVQVVGLLMNSSDAVSGEEVMVMVGIERAVISPACRMDDSREWKVYAKFCFTQDGQPLGDVFVFSLQGDLVAMLCGCQFTKLPILKLEKALDLANSKTAHDSPEPSSHKISIAEPNASSGGAITPAATLSVQNNNDEALGELIAEYIGVDVTEIERDTNFADLGLDSLASVELVGELSSKFGITITSDELFTSCLADLDALLGVPTSVGSEPKRSELKTDLTSYPDEKSLNVPVQNETDQKLQQFFRILIEVSGAKLEDIEQHHLLSDLGVDSLSSVDLKQELEESFAVRLDDSLLECTVKDLLTQLHIDSPRRNTPTLIEEPGRVDRATSNSAPTDKENIALPNPFNALKQSDTHFDASANAQVFRQYWSDVAPFQDEILLAYIVEGFRTLGVDLTRFQPGSGVPQIPYLAQKYDKLVPRL
jgi:acyl carrier protein